MQHTFWCGNVEKLEQRNYILLQLMNLFNLLQTIFLLSIILLHLDEEPLLLAFKTKSSKQKPYIMAWYYVSLQHFQI